MHHKKLIVCFIWSPATFDTVIDHVHLEDLRGDSKCLFGLQRKSHVAVKQFVFTTYRCVCLIFQHLFNATFYQPLFMSSSSSSSFFWGFLIQSLTAVDFVLAWQSHKRPWATIHSEKKKNNFSIKLLNWWLKV